MTVGRFQATSHCIATSVMTAQSASATRQPWICKRHFSMVVRLSLAARAAGAFHQGR